MTTTTGPSRTVQQHTASWNLTRRLNVHRTPWSFLFRMLWLLLQLSSLWTGVNISVFSSIVHELFDINFVLYWQVSNLSGHLSPLSLTKLPSSCGYTVRSTPSNLVLVAPYDGCFVVIEVGFPWSEHTHLNQDFSSSFEVWLSLVVVGEQLCSSVAVVGPPGENVMSYDWTRVIKPSNDHLPCWRHGCANWMDQLCLEH